MATPDPSIPIPLAYNRQYERLELLKATLTGSVPHTWAQRVSPEVVLAFVDELLDRMEEKHA